MRKTPIDHPEKVRLFVLSQLASGYFMQDYDIFGQTPEEVLAYARTELGPANANRLREEIGQFLGSRDCLSDDEFARQYQEIFRSDTPLEGWYGKTTRQWLQKFYEMLSLDKS